MKNEKYWFCSILGCIFGVSYMFVVLTMPIFGVVLAIVGMILALFGLIGTYK